MKAKDIVGKFHLKKPLYYITTTHIYSLSHKVCSTTHIHSPPTHGWGSQNHPWLVQCRMSPAMPNGAQWQRTRVVTHSSSTYSDAVGSPDSTTRVLHVSNSLGTKQRKKRAKGLVCSYARLSVLFPVLLPLSWRNWNTEQKQLALKFIETLLHALPSAWGPTSSPPLHVSLLHDSARPRRDNTMFHMVHVPHSEKFPLPPFLRSLLHQW